MGSTSAVLDEGVGAVAGFGFAGPAGDQGGVQAGVPVGPLAAGELRALLGGEEHQRVVGPTGCVEHGEDLADLAVHVGDFGEVLAKSWRVRGVSARFGGQLDLVGGYCDGSPMTHGTCGSTRAMTRQNGWSSSRVMNLRMRCDVVRVGGVADAVGVKAGDLLERERVLRVSRAPCRRGRRGSRARRGAAAGW